MLAESRLLDGFGRELSTTELGPDSDIGVEGTRGAEVAVVDGPVDGS